MSRETNFTRKVAVTSPDRKPSVFERLGTKSGITSTQNICHDWVQNGTCPLNKQCKFAQTHTLISPSKRSKSVAMKKSVVVHKKFKDENKKSLRSHQNSDFEWEGWELGDLEDADERVLEKRKQELQRELQLQLKKEKELTRKKDKRTEKKRAASSSSSSTSTSDSSSSTTSTSSSSSEPRKHLNRKRKHSSSSSESIRSLQRDKKSLKTMKTKLSSVRKPSDKKDVHVATDMKNKSVIVTKKMTASKKSYSPSWEKSRGRLPLKQQITKKSPTRRSPDVSKNKSSSPRYEKTMAKTKRCYSPKAKSKESSPKRGIKKSKETSVHMKDKSRLSPAKLQNSPSRTRKGSPSRSRRHEESSEKRRNHHDDQKHASRRERSREKDRKRDVTRGRSKDNGGLKKGGKILPLKPPTFNKEAGIKKETIHHKSNTDVKLKEEINEKDRSRSDRDKDRGEKDKNKCERDKARHKKNNDEHDRRQIRERDADRNSVRGRDDRGRERDVERLRFAKERESERQKERNEALERCRERQREREKLEKERKDKDEKKHQRDPTENKSKEFDRELPSLLDLKPDNPSRISGDSARPKSTDQHLIRDCHRISEKGNEKSANQEREIRDRVSTDRDHDGRDSRRSVETSRKQQEKEFESRRNRDEGRNSSDVRRSTLTEARRGAEEGNDSRRQWGDESRRQDVSHDRRRPLDPPNGERRPLPLGRRPADDAYRRSSRADADVADARDFALEERRGSRKEAHNCPDWNVKDKNFDYREPEKRDEWNSHSERHRDWNSRYEHKWADKDEKTNRDDAWNHYSRRGPHEDWNGDWSQEQSRQIYSDADRMDLLNEGYSDQSGRRYNEGHDGRRTELAGKEKESAEPQQKTEASATNSREDKVSRGDGDALSDISDDPDDILNQDDYPIEEVLPANNEQRSSDQQQIYIRSNEFLFDQRRPLLECLGERSLDFEEISDEELEEEARASKGIVDVLGADWAGLLQETRPKIRRPEGSDSAHGRWKMKKIISNLGISHKYAGLEFSDRLIDKCKDTEENEQNYKIKIDAIFHSIPALHSAMRDAEKIKSILFTAQNRFKRALSARTDLSLRRELCNLTSKEPLHFTPPLDNRLYEVSVQQFHSGGPTTTAAV